MTRKPIGLMDGTAYRPNKLSRAETVAMMIDAESGMTSREIADRYGLGQSYVETVWDRIHDAGGIAGYEVDVPFRPNRHGAHLARLSACQRRDRHRTRPDHQLQSNALRAAARGLRNDVS